VKKAAALAVGQHKGVAAGRQRRANDNGEHRGAAEQCWVGPHDGWLVVVESVMVDGTPLRDWLVSDTKQCSERVWSQSKCGRRS